MEGAVDVAGVGNGTLAEIDADDAGCVRLRGKSSAAVAEADHRDAVEGAEHDPLEGVAREPADHQLAGKLTSCGRPWPRTEMAILGPDGQALADGEIGEIAMRGGIVMRRYWNRPEALAQSFDGDWFRTGDVAYLDDEAFLFIVDRIKDLIIRGGENIGCGQVEAALLLHPGVHEAAVYALPDERLGEEVGATVHGEPGLTPAALQDFLAAHLARFEIPRHITVSPLPLPRTASGKLLKRQLRQAALAAMDPPRDAA